VVAVRVAADSRGRVPYRPNYFEEQR